VRFILVAGSVKAAIGLAMLMTLPLLGETTEATRTAVFLFESIALVAYVYPSRQLHMRPLGNRVLNAIVLLSIALQPLLVEFAATRRILGLAAIEPRVWGILLGAVLLAWLFADFYCRRLRRTAGLPFDHPAVDEGPGVGKTNAS
jgi:hypothetical protein